MLLPCDQIHLWQATLDTSPLELDRYARLLSEEETIRAARFLFPQTRIRFIAGRGILRELLAAYQDVQPEEIRLSYNRYGKPCLQGGGSYFNLSHTGGTVLYAVSRTAEVGVDIEAMRKDFDWEEMSFALSARERAELKRSPLPNPHEAFLQRWVRREALCKAAGKGLSCIWPKGALGRSSLDAWQENDALHLWSVRDLMIGEDVVGAVATDRRGMVLKHFNWTEQRALLRKGYRP